MPLQAIANPDSHLKLPQTLQPHHGTAAEAIAPIEVESPHGGLPPADLQRKAGPKLNNCYPAGLQRMVSNSFK